MFIVSKPDELIEPLVAAATYSARRMKEFGEPVTGRQLERIAQLLSQAQPDLLWVNGERTVLARLFQMDNCLEVARRGSRSESWGVPDMLFLEPKEPSRAA